MSEDAAKAKAKVRVDLHGVPETLLWNLYHRAQGARGRRPVLADPKAVEILDRIDYDFSKFKTPAAAGQWQALRVAAFDAEVRRFLQRHPAGTVVALGEGLETQFWRVDNGSVRWLSVDLPETLGIRRRLLPDGPRNTSFPASALDARWAEEVDASNGVLVTAQGLLMYLQRDEVDTLVALCAGYFPDGALLFDAVPAWMIARQSSWSQKDSASYRPPQWVWGMDEAERARIAALPGIREVREVPPVRGRGFVFGALLPAMQRNKRMRARLPIFPVLLAEFEAQRGA
jgi:O-methyltransferase involved in polyketide biosynthesis